MLSIFQPLGVVVCSGIAYGFIPKYSCGNGSDGNPLKACSNLLVGNDEKAAKGEPCCTKASNMGWRYTMFTLGGICLGVFFLRFVVFRFQESPKFLIYRGKDEKAVKVLQHIAKFNGRETTISIEDFDALTDEDTSVGSGDTGSPILAAGAKQMETTWLQKLKIEFVRLKILFSTKAMTYLTILIWITYIFDYWGFSVAGEQDPELSQTSVLTVTQATIYQKFCWSKIRS